MVGSDLISSARKLLADPSSPSDRRRAVSTAYYALFNALCRACANFLVGVSSERARYQIFRALDHSNVKARCLDTKNKDLKFPIEVSVFANTLVELYESRQEADYCPNTEFDTARAEDLVNQAEQALKELNKLTPKHMKAFAIFVLLKPGKGRDKKALNSSHL